MDKRSIRKVVLPLIPLSFFLIFWEYLSTAELINYALFPPPTEIFQAMLKIAYETHDGQSVLLLHLSSTLTRLAWGFTYGAIFGILLGMLMGGNKWVYKFCQPIVTFFMPIPGIAMAPLFMVWLGLGDQTIITVGAIAMFFPVLFNVAAGVRSVDKQLENAALIVGSSKLGIYKNVHLPWTMANLLTGLKLGLARCWRTIIAVELIATATWGLGFMITDASDYLQLDVVFGGIFLMAIIFLIFEKIIFKAIEKYTVQRWGMVR
jgi:ABC-type nitrate/sulfonate/bicarbonate transport system permease component